MSQANGRSGRPTTHSMLAVVPGEITCVIRAVAKMIRHTAATEFKTVITFSQLSVFIPMLCSSGPFTKGRCHDLLSFNGCIKDLAVCIDSALAPSQISLPSEDARTERVRVEGSAFLVAEL